MTRPLAAYRGWTIERNPLGGVEAVHPQADEPIYADDLVLMMVAIDRFEETLGETL